MAHNNDGGRVHPRDAGRRETDAELWAAIRNRWGDANDRPGGGRPHRVARNRQHEDFSDVDSETILLNTQKIHN
ncbi:Hypothetical predicted protein [Olea europaea subsp. europaea]|uniref:Uncharacterized protein n=1 Tax=Olea europaea subsp. europaea TaxID=158383 RepID=A0A8S0TXV3_OLEEU|nr:Hypothetical predicted protein [Olea europaea subsp. europaea]